MTPLQIALGAMALASISLNGAFAQPPALAPATPCALYKDRNDGVAKLLAASNAETRRNLIAATVAGDPSNTVCLMESVARLDSAGAKPTLLLMLDLLAKDGDRHAALVQQLLAENPELVSEAADTEPGGGDDSPSDLGSTTGGEAGSPAENPQQLNLRTDAPSVSPASPADF